MPVVLIAFIIMITLAVWSPGAREELASEGAVDGAVTAGQLRSWHAAAVRSCYNMNVLTCTSNRRINKNEVLYKLPDMMASSPAFDSPSFGSYFENGYVISFYAGYYPGYGPNLQAEAVSEALSALVASASPATLTSVGYWNQQTGMFRSGSYTSVLNGAGTRMNAVQFATMPQAYMAGWPVPNGTPMLVTRLR